MVNELQTIEVDLEAVRMMDVEEAFGWLDSLMCQTIQVREESGRRACALLATVKSIWDSLSLTTTAKWEHDFYVYAYARTGGYSQVAIDNMINVGSTFLVGDLPACIPEEVQLYDRAGNPLDTIVRPQDVMPSMSKLLVSTAAAKDGRLEQNPKALGQLFNPDVSVHVLSDTIQGRSPLPPPSSEIKLWIEDYLIIAEQGKESEWVLEMNTSTNPIVVEALKYIIEQCKLERRGE